MASKKSKKSSGNVNASSKLLTVVVIALLVIAGIWYVVSPDSFMSTFASVMGDGSDTQTALDETAAPGETYNTQTAAPSAGDGDNDATIIDGKNLEVYVLDVGQGDSLFFMSPNGKTMLIDASESKYFEVIQEFLDSNGITKLDVVIATHPHSDHIGAMRKIIENYDIGTFYMPTVTHTSSTYEKMITALEDNSVPVEYTFAGEDSFIEWDESCEVLILSPFDGIEYDDLNNWSTVVRVKYGDNAIMCTGDAEFPAEEIMLDKLPLECFKADVLKMGHHGSSTSTSPNFLQAVDPDAVVISCGEGNDYGHPHRETLEIIEQYRLACYRTDTQGTIHITFTGTEVKYSTEK